jgi:hypothetical protein
MGLSNTNDCAFPRQYYWKQCTVQQSYIVYVILGCIMVVGIGLILTAVFCIISRRRRRRQIASPIMTPRQRPRPPGGIAHHFERLSPWRTRPTESDRPPNYENLPKYSEPRKEGDESSEARNAG